MRRQSMGQSRLPQDLVIVTAGDDEEPHEALQFLAWHGYSLRHTHKSSSLQGAEKCPAMQLPGVSMSPKSARGVAVLGLFAPDG